MFDMGGLKLDKKMAEQTLKEKTAKGLFWGGLNGGIQTAKLWMNCSENRKANP